MVDTTDERAHTFHVPVMGTGFVIDAPLRVGRYGIASVISLVDDVLIEQMRRLHCQREGEPYEAIADDAEDARARRITEYLNLLDRIVARQLEALRAAPFEPGSEITRYFELLPEGELAQSYRAMLAESDAAEKLRRQEHLRRRVRAGSIDVNIMSKGDRDAYHNGQKLAPRYSDASAALRGYAESTLRSSIVFSAGFNPRLYGYIAEFDDFFPDAEGRFKKQIILKVSDYRSAEIQAKFLAKRGLWVSEFRVESGLNCGGHAFPTKGLLLGPILEEFRRRRSALLDELQNLYAKALARRGRAASEPAGPPRITVQGGIGTAAEDAMFREVYGADGTGWGTPFLLVPEVTNVDPAHLEKLCAATAADVYLSDSSPFGMPFWNLRTSASEDARRERIGNHRPGSSCVKGFVKLFNTEFSERPICTASRQYQDLKLKQIDELAISDAQRAVLRESVLAKSCICHDLAGGATLKNHIDADATPAICCGPNIVHFGKVATLEEMVGHIYGRVSLLNGSPRAHVLLREIELYLDFARDQLKTIAIGLAPCEAGDLHEFRDHLLQGIEHYREKSALLAADASDRFLEELDRLRGLVNALPWTASC